MTTPTSTLAQIPTAAPVPSPPAPSLPEWVFHPDLLGRIAYVLAGLPRLVLAHLPVVGAVAAVLLAAAVRILLLRRAEQRRWHAEAHMVTVLAPAGLDAQTAMQGAQRAWRDLHDLARPRWKRLLRGQPHLATEIWVLPRKEPLLRIWVPGTTPPGRVENALRAAWPGCLLLDDTATPSRDTTDTPGMSTPDADVSSSREQGSHGVPGSSGMDPMAEVASAATVTAGRVTPRRAEYLPLRIPAPREDADPLRTLEALAERLEDGEAAVVQILARTALGHRLRRYRAHVTARHDGRPARSGLFLWLVTGLVRAVLDLLTPGPGSQSSHTAARRAVDPLVSEELHAIREKANSPLFEVALRYAVTSRATGHSARKRVRGIADTLAATFAVLSGRNQLRRRPLRHPEKILPARRLHHTSLWSIPELATLAHVPVRTRDLAGHFARGIPAPDTVTHTEDP